MVKEYSLKNNPDYLKGFLLRYNRKKETVISELLDKFLEKGKYTSYAVSSFNQDGFISYIISVGTKDRKALMFPRASTFIRPNSKLLKSKWLDYLNKNVKDEKFETLQLSA